MDSFAAQLEENSLINAVDRYLRVLVKKDGSDLHLLSGERPRIRLYGELEFVDEFPRSISANELKIMLTEIMDEDKRSIFLTRKGVDFSYEMAPFENCGATRFRVNAFRYQGGLGAVFRYLPGQLKSYKELGIPEVLMQVMELPNGLILVTGPTGSGKSTTMACMINHVIQMRKVHIITIEDPIEFVFQSSTCQITQREVGMHTPSFLDGLRDALREDPDVIMVGEMRDPETISMAIRAALTGHLVISTLHTNSAAQTIDRIIESFPSEEQNQIRNILSDSIRAIVSQSMFKRIDRPGRVVAFEIVLANAAVRNLIREGKTHQMLSAIQSGRALGMRSLDESIKELVNKKIISPRDAYIKAVNKKEFRHLVKGEKTSLLFELV